LPYTDEYDDMSGTSAATPFVSGLASLLLSVKPDLYNDDVEAIVRVSANKYPDFNTQRGYGRIDAYKALQLLLPPYSLTWSTANGSGCTTTLIREDRKGSFLHIDGLTPNVYWADIYEVTKEVAYDKTYVAKPEVWGRGWPTTGYSLANPNSGVGYTKVTDVTKTSCRLTTYIYDLYTFLKHEYVGRYPCEPSQVQYAYSILGIEDRNPPEVTVAYANGGEYFRSGETIFIQWEVEDEYLEGVRCGVQYNTEGGSGYWIAIAGDIPVDSEGHGECEYRIPCGIPRIEDECRIQVIAIDNNQHQGLDISDNNFTIEYINKGGDGSIPVQGVYSPAPDKNFLSAPIPNPFNPRTVFHFGVEEPSRISLIVYDVAGGRVKTFYHDSFMNSGEYTEVWNGIGDSGMSVPSGVYFLVFRAGNFTKMSKLILLR
jgi:hypothetical protein